MFDVLSTKIMYPWGLEKLQMDAPFEVSSFSRPHNYTVKPPLTARIKMLHPCKKTGVTLYPYPIPHHHNCHPR